MAAKKKTTKKSSGSSKTRKRKKERSPSVPSWATAPLPSSMSFKDRAETIVDALEASGRFESKDGLWSLIRRGDTVEVSGQAPKEVIDAVEKRNLSAEEHFIERARGIHWRRHYNAMESAARDILERASDPDEGGFTDYEDARDWINDEIHTFADSAVIYTHDNIRTIVDSENWLAVDDDPGLLEGVEDFTSILTRVAYEAIRRDVEEQVERLEGEYFTNDDEDNEDDED